MSAETCSGGGRRQHSIMNRRRVRLSGPMTVVLAAGAVFGISVWEPPRTQDTDDARSASMLRQPDRVTEDATGLHLAVLGEPADATGTEALSSRVGWLRTGGREESLPDRVRLPMDEHEGRSGLAGRDDQNEGSHEVPTSSLHSRGPPHVK